MEVLRESLKAEADNLRKQAEPIWEALEGHERDQRAFESSLVNFEQQRLCITVVGEFNTGKSTLLNSFIGEPLLQTDQLECTAVPTWVWWVNDEDFDANRQATVVHTDGEADSMPLSQVSVHTTLDLASSWENIERVEIKLPRPIGVKDQSTGLMLVDTPGLNGNQELGSRSIHQLGMAHVTIVVVPVDGIGRKSDIDLIEEARSISDRVMVVINKCDQQKKRSDGFEKFKEELRERIPALHYKDIYTISAKREFDGVSTYQDGEDELKKEFDLFRADLTAALDESASALALRKRPVVLLRKICEEEIARVKKLDTECHPDVSKEVELAKTRLQKTTTNLESSREEILRLARKAMMGELGSLEHFLTEQQREVDLKMKEVVDKLKDAMLLEQDNLDTARKSVSKRIEEILQELIFSRASRLLRASARRLIFDLEERGVGKVDVDLPEVAPLQIDTATLEQHADRAHEALSRHRSEIEILKQEVERCRKTVKRRKTKADTLDKQCVQLENLKVKYKEAVANIKRLGLKPSPKVEYYTAYETKKVKHGGTGLLDWWLGPKIEKVAVKRQRRKYNHVEKWEREFKAARKKASDLYEKMSPLNNMPKEKRKIEGELRKLERESENAQASLISAEKRLACERSKYRRSSLETRRAQLRECARRELEKIFDSLPHALERKAEEMLKRISQGFSSRFKEAADRQRKSLADEIERKKRLAHAGDNERAKRTASCEVLEETLKAFFNEDQGGIEQCKKI